VGGGDGLLALDRNHDGAINDGSELFGSGTTLANGQKAGNGYQAMAELDTNGDGVVSSADSAFADLRVWVDGNADGVSQANELKSLADLGIKQLDLNGKQDASLNNGNIVGMTSTFETTDGASHTAADVWFQMQAPADLRGSVTSLVQAMASYGSDGGNAGEGKLPTLDALKSSSGVNASVAQMADALKQYDAKLLGAGEGLASTDDSLRLKALQSTGNHGLLAAK
jgi:hypothetical protein